MKVRIERDAFADAVSWVLRCVGSRATLPVLGGVLISAEGQEVQLVGTDLELTGEARAPASVEEGGRLLLPGRILGDIARSLPEGTVRLEGDAGQGRIKCGSAEFALRTLPAEDFPEVGSPSTAASRVAGKLFATAVTQVAKAASHDEARPVLTGVLLEAGPGKITMVATDSYRLAVREIEWAEGVEARRVVPARALLEAAKAAEGEAEVGLTVGETQVAIHAGGRTLTTRLIEGDFPNWRQLVPTDQPNQLTIARDGFGEAVRRVGILAQQGTPVRLELSASGVRMTAGTQDLGEASEEVTGTYQGEPLTVAFNPAYLADGVAAVSGEELRLSARDNLKPALLSSAQEDGFLYLLMPVRIS